MGRPSIHSMRAIWECIQYQATTGCQWRMLPKNFAPFTTVQYHFIVGRTAGYCF
ncbi:MULTISPECIES: transposase [Acidiphilium]|uniref:transposase n=1 Tax=Acidiphilium TaxID=522 RepID=UPI0038CD16A7